MLVIQSKKTDYNTKINEVETKISDNSYDKYITTPKFNKLAETFCSNISTIKFSKKYRF